MAKAKIQLSPEVLAYFRQEGLRGGSKGGRKAAANMTAAERSERARKAGLAAAASRRERQAKAKRRAG